MKIKTITFTFTKNLGNYQSQKLEASADVEPNETPEEALRKLQLWVLDHSEQNGKPF